MEGENSSEMVICFICGKEFTIDDDDERFASELNSYEIHLVGEHKILIPKFENWTDFIQFHSSISDEELDRRFSPLVINRFNKEVTYKIIDKEKFDEDDEQLIRKVIERDFLENILRSAQDERNCTNFDRTCLFCKKRFNQNRAQLFDHLYHDHNFFLGHPDNIINSNELLDMIECKLKMLQCLYCEKNFKSWNVLKEHMRKKAHKLLNPNNREYDRFYLINYLCSDKHWRQIKQENDFYVDNYNNDDWCDWIEDDKQDCLCFFCSFAGKFDNVKHHMREIHRFDFSAIIFSLQDFYDRIKVVNFIRKRLCSNHCFNCDTHYDDFEPLSEHMTATNHIAQIPPKDMFDHPEYYFSALDDDGFLFFLDDFRDEDRSENQ